MGNLQHRTGIDDLELLVGAHMDGLDNSSPLADVLEVREFIKAIKAVVKGWSEQSEGLFLEWLEANGEQAIGDIRYYAAPNTTWKPKESAEAVLGRLFELTGGDLTMVAKLLASGPFKAGSIAKTLGDDVRDELFERVVTSKTKEGKPKSVAQEVNTAFLR